MDFSSKIAKPRARRHEFAEVAAMLLSNAPEVCKHLLPAGKLHGHEYSVGDLHGSRGASLSINVRTGVWKDFHTDDKGADLIALWAAVNGLSQGDAKTAAERWLGLEGAADSGHRKDGKPAVQSAQPPPSSDDDDWWRTAKPSRKWDYRNAAGEVVGTVYRFDAPGRKKIIRPWDGHDWKAPKPPRPLYRLPEIMAHQGPVVLVEGEKAADAVVEAGYCGTTFWGGASAASQTDWTPLAYRDVVMWPDNDPTPEPGKVRAADVWLKMVGDILRDVGVATARVVR